MISFTDIPPWFWKKLNLHNNVVNNNNSTPTIWCLWNNTYNLTVLLNTAQCIAFRFEVAGVSLYIAAIYASTHYLTRRNLWLELTSLLNEHQGPWLFIGDFNSILGAQEKLGSRLPLHIACSEFLGWTNLNSLIHLATNGAKYTWTNKREGGAFIAQRLDRAICTESWVDQWEVMTCNTLVRCHSDHFPLLLNMHKQSPINIIPRFKFFKAWTTIEGCEALISAHWRAHVVGTPMHVLHYKLKSLKPKLQLWNKEVVGNLNHRVTHAQQQLYEAQLTIDQLGFSTERSNEEVACMANYSQALNLLNSFWQNKFKHARFIEGDRNTAFFHRSAKIRDAQSYISLLKDGTDILSNSEDIEAHVLSYFTNIFSVNSDYVENDLPNKYIPQIVTLEENAMLTAIPPADEVKRAVFDLSGDAAPGPDGYSGHFYQCFWGIVGEDVVKSTQYFFLHNYIMPNLNSNLLILIPKVPGADKLDNFRPIALANFQFKIITKILADRLGLIAAKIISPNQRGFIPGRHIHDCIMTASEAVNLLHKKAYGGNLAMKIDVRKAFDTVNWQFLIHVLRRFGFTDLFCNWILSILHSAKLSVSVNGKSVGFFSCTRGVRQGNPLSPLLFCIAEEVISRGIEALVLEGKVSQIRASRNLYVPSHCLYADDILIFCKGTLANVKNIMHLFELYGQYSGQLVNARKSKFYSTTISLSRAHTIASITGFSHGNLPFTYLGFLLFKGKPKTIHLRHIVDRIHHKLSAWKGRLLTIMGRVQLINAVISSMFTYSFQVYKWPPSLLHEVAKSMRNFLWSGNCDQRKVCTVAWSKVCKPRAEGGLSVKDPIKVNQASLILLAWKLLSSDEQWAIICRHRYLRDGKPKSHYITSSVWPGLKQHVQFVIDHSQWSVGNGKDINFWNDRWLTTIIASRWNLPAALLSSLRMQVSDCIIDGKWCLPGYIEGRDPELAHQIHSLTLPVDDIPDQLHWINSTDGKLTNKIAYTTLVARGPSVQWADLIWNTFIPPSRAFITWRLLHNKLPTDDNLRKRGCYIVSICCFCKKQAESSHHLFFDCPVTFNLWDWLSKGTDHTLDSSSCLQLLLGRAGVESKFVQQILNAAIIHTIWAIWLERNQRCFHDKKQSMATIFNHILAEVKLSHNLCMVKCNSVMQEFKISRLFNIPFRSKRVSPIKLLGILLLV